MSQTYVVISTELNLRRTPRVQTTNGIAVLPQAQTSLATPLHPAD